MTLWVMIRMTLWVLICMTLWVMICMTLWDVGDDTYDLVGDDTYDLVGDDTYDLVGDDMYDLVGDDTYDLVGDDMYDLVGDDMYDLVGVDMYDLVGDDMYDLVGVDMYDLVGDDTYDLVGDDTYDLEFDHPRNLLSNPQGYFSQMVEQTGSTMETSLRKVAEEVSTRDLILALAIGEFKKPASELRISISLSTTHCFLTALPPIRASRLPYVVRSRLFALTSAPRRLGASSEPGSKNSLVLVATSSTAVSVQ
uniref:Uncharacterized protein n=1 Tax=Timema genevievae TaxID=629358 RepID=A0A7R9PIN6_TIMGE|nr:unnamed protein product [Timema genevievae]